MNPLDRNHDGKVNAQDLTGNRQGLHNNIVNPGMTQTTTSTTTSAGVGSHNPLDRNHDGRVDLKDLSGRQNQQGLGMNQGLNQGAHHNPLDRNHDGRVDARDLSGQSGYNQQGLGMNQGLGLNQGAHHNPLDRNHDGRVDARDFAGQQGVGTSQTVYVQSAKRSSLSRAEPVVMETVHKNVVVQERIHPVMKEEIQPVIYREREQLDVKQVTQMMHETQIQPTIIQQRELPAQTRAAVIERGAPIAENYVASSREVDQTMRTQVVHAPIVNEVIKKTIIEEIQPVLERDIIQSTVIQNTQPIYEKIVEAPHVYRETVVVTHDRGIVGGGSLASLEAQGFNIGTTGRRLSQGYTGNPLAGQGLGMNQGVHHNPLDRNHDGRVDARDLSGQSGYNQQGLGMNQGLNQGAHHNPLDRNHDGRVDARDLSGQTGYNQQGLGMNQGAGMHQNPLDRNHDGRVNLKDLTGQPGMNQQGLGNQGLGMNQGAGMHQNPLDRNHDGKVDLKDLSGRQNTASANRPVNLL